MAISDRLTKLATDITNAYTSIENKGGTIPSDKNTNNLATAIDSIEVIEEATAEGEDLHLTNTKAMPFKSVKVNGKTEQNTTTGANLMKFTARTSTSFSGYSCDSKGQVTATGTPSQYLGLSYNTTDNYISLSAGSYKVKVIGNAENVLFQTNNAKAVLSAFNENQEAILTVTEDITNFQIFQYFNTPYTYNCNYYLTLASGTTATTERYTNGASPNPSYPQEIKNVEGKNKFGISSTFPITKNGLTFNKNSDGTITINGTATTTFTQTFNLVNEVLNGNYVIKHNVVSGTVSGACYLSIQDSNNNNISDRVYGGTTFGSLSLDNITIVTAGLYITSGTVFSNYTVGTMLEEGSTPTPYVPYNSIEFEAENKNLLDVLNNTRNGYISSTGVYTANVYNIISDYVAVKSGEKYTLSYKEQIEVMAISEYDSTKNFIQRQQATSKKENTFTLTNNTKYVIVGFSNGSSVNMTPELWLSYKPQLEQNLISSSYVPHAEQTALFTFEEGQYLAEGGYLADDGTHNIYTKTKITNVSSIGTASTGIKYAQVGTIISAKQNGNVYCSKYIYSSDATKNNSIRLVNNVLYVYDNTFTSIEIAQEALIGLEYQFERATESITPYTPTQQAQYYKMQRTFAYEDVTNTSTDGDLKPSTELKYYKKK